MELLLCFNTGSSSLSVALFRRGSATPQWAGGIDLTAERMSGVFSADASEGPAISDSRDFPEVARAVLRFAGDGALPVHRIVHGGETAKAAAWVDAAEFARLEALGPLAPLHQAQGLALVRALQDERSDLRQVAVFDTAFHRTLPDIAKRLPVPSGGPFQGLRRFGFHGLSHGFVAQTMAAEAPERGRVVSLHLSGGASACAIMAGSSVDTTMGATPLDGLMMGTRCGAIDPGLLLYALEQGMSRQALAELLWKRSGLKGVSGISADLRDILPQGGPDADLAVALYCRSAAKAVATMAVAMCGIDAVVFTGGAGAQQPVIRERIARDLAWMELRLDGAANSRDAAVISAADSAVLIRVIPAEEERMMARYATDLLEEAA